MHDEHAGWFSVHTPIDNTSAGQDRHHRSVLVFEARLERKGLLALGSYMAVHGRLDLGQIFFEQKTAPCGKIIRWLCVAMAEDGPEAG